MVTVVMVSSAVFSAAIVSSAGFISRTGSYRGLSMVCPVHGFTCRFLNLAPIDRQPDDYRGDSRQIMLNELMHQS